MKEILIFTRTAILFFFILWAVFFFVVGIKMAPNGDMYPRIDAGDIMLYYRLDKTVNAQDIIVLKKNGTEYIGRVVAKEGDTIEVTKEANLMINGNLVVEDNIFYSTPQYEGFQNYPLKLSAGQCFVLVDKREGGEDSRFYGPVNQDEIKGTLVGLYRRIGF